MAELADLALGQRADLPGAGNRQIVNCRNDALVLGDTGVREEGERGREDRAGDETLKLMPGVNRSFWSLCSLLERMLFAFLARTDKPKYLHTSVEGVYYRHPTITVS